MKRLFLIPLLGALLLASCAATRTPADLELDRLKHEVAANALRSGEFVLEAYQLQFRRGTTAQVSSLTNFVAMSGGKATVQISFNNGRPGSNGLGGITLDGEVSDLKTNIDKHGNIDLEFNVLGSFLSAQIEVMLYNGSTRAVAVVNPTFSGDRLTLYGNIVPAEASSIFKGQTPP